jgi:hypothetical protein
MADERKGSAYEMIQDAGGREGFSIAAGEPNPKKT